ncbi:beta-1,3-galactosyltransferase 5-like isoform X2 [Uloborus diversus]|uniref:beta-1,3-galactosyltransferase 5-like isoform X2 n=1 Tax=Uloborus diversus TaxID=327109 RepID=UPI00240A3C58|nr:beta-1,3-galactosyltransferase 5-like isoform X2 [Uloborus diversus]
MSSEKNPPVYTEKSSIFGDEYPKKKICSKSVVSWVLAALLVALIVVISIQFLYPIMEARYRVGSENFNSVEDNPVEVRVISPVMIPPYVASEEGNDSSDKASDSSSASSKISKSKSSVSSQMSKEKSKSKESSSSESLKEKSKSKKKDKPWHLEFLINPSHLCATRMPAHSEKYQTDPELKLLIIVPSSPDHFEQRRAIRATWGSIAQKPRGPMRLGFIMGTTDDESVSNLLREESEECGDIIQAEFEDGYKQATVKSIAMLKWVAKYCAHALYFLKADDDTFVNVGMIARLLSQEPFLSEERFIGGYIHEEMYYVSEEDYPDEVYPPFASGSAYITTGPSAVELFDASQRVEPILPLDDVFVTGLCAQDVEITLIHEPRFRVEEPPKPPTWNTYSNLATVNSMVPDDLFSLWEDMSRAIIGHLMEQEAAINATVILRRK